MSAWQQVAPGQFRRPLDPVELPFTVTLSLGCEHWGPSLVLDVHVTCGADDTIAALRRAWTTVRYFHPHIASVLDQQTKSFIYTIPDETSLQAWLHDSFFVHDDDSDGLEDFVRQWNYSEYSSLHYFTRTSQIVIRSHHWLIDGLGLCNLANRLLLFLSKDGIDEVVGYPPPFGTESARLPPGVIAAARFPSERSDALTKKGQDTIMGFASNLPSVGLPTLTSPQPRPSGSRYHRLSFAENEFSEILKTSKDKNISIGSATLAAMILATQEMANESAVSTRKYSAVLPFNYRKHLPTEYADSQTWPVALWVLNLPICVAEGDFKHHLDACQKYHKQDLSPEGFHMFDASFEAFMNTMITLLSTPPPPEWPPMSFPTYSSLGLLDDIIKARQSGKHTVVVKQVEPIAATGMADVTVYQWSFAGRFNISIDYNEHNIASSVAEAFLQRMHDIVIKGMASM